MSLSTNIPLKYRTPYIPGQEPSPEIIKEMKHEASLMRKNLIKKQQALQRSNQYKSNEKLYDNLKNLKINDLTTDKQIQDEWARLRYLEISNSTSVTGKRIQAQQEIESFTQAGFEGLNQKNINQLNAILDEFRESEYSKLYSYEEIVQMFINHKEHTSNLEELIAYYG